MTDEQLLDLYQAAITLKSLHKEGLELSRQHADKKMAEYRQEILKRMQHAQVQKAQD